jgi:hypothetical protein
MFPKIAHNHVVSAGLRRGGRARGVTLVVVPSALHRAGQSILPFFLSCCILQVGLASVRLEGSVLLTYAHDLSSVFDPLQF